MRSVLGVAIGLIATAALAFAPAASGAEAEGADCPPVPNKAEAMPHVQYEGMQELTYCYGPIDIKPGQNIIRLNSTNLHPHVPGYITRFDPDLVYADGTVPPVDVLHLHHAVWLVNLNPQFAAGEEKSIAQLPQGFGWRNKPTDAWYLNDMLHELVAHPAQVYIVWRLDFVPDTAPGAASIRTVKTRWMDVSGVQAYPVFDALRKMGGKRRYTFPNQAKGDALQDVGLAQTWNVDHPVTLISTVGHLHPGGIKDSLRVWRKGKSTAIFKSWAHYYEPAGAVSWDVAMSATPDNWRVQLQPGDALSVHATYDSKRADWYEVMGIMPVAYYDGHDVGGYDPFDKSLNQQGILTHGHLSENDNHGGYPAGLPIASTLPSMPWKSGPVRIDAFHYSQGDLHGKDSAINPPTIDPGQRLKFKSFDAGPEENAFHTITSCRAPCNRATGVAYPLANGRVTFDSGQLGYNYTELFDAPAADRVSRKTPRNLQPGTYNYFCRIHPFMRGSFRVAQPKH